MSSTSNVPDPIPATTVDVEYCGKCNFRAECAELMEQIRRECPTAKLICREGRRGSFEVRINDQLVHSKLATLAFPLPDDVTANVKAAQQGRPVQKVAEQPITDCVLQ